MKNTRSIFRSVFIVTLAILFIGGVSSVFAAPTQPPASGSGVDLPLHVGGAGQTKAGALTVNGTLTASGALNVGGTLSVPTICLNGSCSTGWPAASVTPSSASANTTIYMNYCNNCGGAGGWKYNGSTTVTVGSSGTLINAYPTAGCPQLSGYNAVYSDVIVSIANPFSRTANVSVVCGYDNWISWPNATFTIGGITI